LCQLDICDVYVKAAAAAKVDDEDDVSDGDGDGSAIEKCNEHFFDLHRKLSVFLHMAYLFC